MLDALSKTFGFKYLIFWQPVGALNPPEHTQPSDTLSRDSAFRHLYAQSTRAVCTPGRKHFHDITRALEGLSADLMYDYVHVLVEGNTLIARRMADIFISRFGDRTVHPGNAPAALAPTLPDARETPGACGPEN